MEELIQDLTVVLNSANYRELESKKAETTKNEYCQIQNNRPQKIGETPATWQQDTIGGDAWTPEKMTHDHHRG